MVMNIDSDLYSSALYVLTSMHPLLRSGDYVYFDEFFDALNEFSAFNDYVRAYNSKTWFEPSRAPMTACCSGSRCLRRATPAEAIDRRSTTFLERLKAYVRAGYRCLANDPAN